MTRASSDDDPKPIKMTILRVLPWLFLLAESAQASTFKISLAMGGETFLKGEPVYCWIRYQNNSTTDAFFLIQSSGASLEVTDARGSALDYVGALHDEFITFSKFAPGESRVVRFDILFHYKLWKPGKYSARYRLSSRDVEQQSAREPQIPQSKLVRYPEISSAASFEIIDPGDEVSRLLTEPMSLFYQANDIIQRYPASPYIAAARAMAMTRLRMGSQPPHTRDELRVREASALLKQLCLQRANRHRCAPLAAEIIEDAIRHQQMNVANHWMEYLKREFGRGIPAAFARMKEAQLYEREQVWCDKRDRRPSADSKYPFCLHRVFASDSLASFLKVPAEGGAGRRPSDSSGVERHNGKEKQSAPLGQIYKFPKFTFRFEVSDVKRSQTARGLRMILEEDGVAKRIEAGFLKIHELKALSLAVDYIYQLVEEWKGTRRKPYVAVFYETETGLRIGFFQEGSRQSTFVQNGSGNPAFILDNCCYSDFFNMRGMIRKAIGDLNVK